MLSRIRQVLASSQAAPGHPSTEQATRVDLGTLVQLHHPARLIPLRAGSIRASGSGQYGSRFRGRGMEYDESRPYTPGDDTRNLDWRVTARTGRVHTKLFREERERPVILAVDYRPAMFFATRGRFKSVLASHLAALLAWSADQHGDRIGGQILTATGVHEYRPQRGRKAVLHLLRQLQRNSRQAPPDQVQPPASNKPPSLAAAIQRLRRVTHPGSLVVLISDFRGLDREASAALAQLGAHADLILIAISDPLEEHLPPPGYYRLSDGRRSIDLDSADRQFDADYQQRFRQRQETLRVLARQSRARLITAHTGDDPLTVLMQGLGLVQFGNGVAN